jgi:hypothetical protein
MRRRVGVCLRGFAASIAAIRLTQIDVARTLLVAAFLSIHTLSLTVLALQRKEQYVADRRVVGKQHD